MLNDVSVVRLLHKQTNKTQYEKNTYIQSKNWGTFFTLYSLNGNLCFSDISESGNFQQGVIHISADAWRGGV